MTLLNKHALFTLLLCQALVACRLDLSAPSSGSIVSESGAFACNAAEVCSIDISDSYFDETFVAVPQEGFEFTGWKREPGAFCGGSVEPCRLETSAFAGNDPLMALLEDPELAFQLKPGFQSLGFESLFIGHSFFRPFAEGLPDHAQAAGIPNHRQSLVFSGGATGAPEALWENTNKRAEIQALLDAGDIELFGMTYHPDYPSLRGYRLWIDYALAANPATRIVIALPWTTYPEEVDAVRYSIDWHAFHTGEFRQGIDALRAEYPATEIFSIPYGQAAVELRTRFAAGELPDVEIMTSQSEDAIFRDALGHADDILIDLGRLVWLNAIYGVDLASYDHDPGYEADLKRIAQSIMDAHDPVYNAPYR